MTVEHEPAAQRPEPAGMTLNLAQGPDAIQEQIKRVASTIGSDQQLNDLARGEFARLSDSALLRRATPDEARDNTRETITLWLIGLFAAVIVMSFAALFISGVRSRFDPEFFKNFKDLLSILLGPVVALLSSAIGFYFGYEKGTASATAAIDKKLPATGRAPPGKPQ